MFGRTHQADEAKEWAALYALGALSEEEKASFERHLLDGCSVCQGELQKFENVAAEIALVNSTAPPASLLATILAQIPKQSGAETSQSAPDVLFQYGGVLISRSSELPWKPAPIPGVWSKTLWVDAARKYSTSLVRLDPGAVYPPHRHNDIEEIYLLEGHFLVEGIDMQPGDYCRSEPGSIHGPSKTESGGLILIFSSERDEILA